MWRKWCRKSRPGTVTGLEELGKMGNAEHRQFVDNGLGQDLCSKGKVATVREFFDPDAEKKSRHEWQATATNPNVPHTPLSELSSVVHHMTRIQYGSAAKLGVRPQSVHRPILEPIYLSLPAPVAMLQSLTHKGWVFHSQTGYEYNIFFSMPCFESGDAVLGEPREREPNTVILRCGPVARLDGSAVPADDSPTGGLAARVTDH
ncbi:hypothetical protein H4582DRAFT_2057865 [Lactarius indigo]|nr:hypothetical protein H4582DRAFT_2057865 [Lactarius indigo]